MIGCIITELIGAIQYEQTLCAPNDGALGHEAGSTCWTYTLDPVLSPTGELVSDEAT